MKINDNSGNNSCFTFINVDTNIIEYDKIPNGTTNDDSDDTTQYCFSNIILL